MPRSRLAYIDLMKGLCIMLIVMHHTDPDFFDSLKPGLDNALQSFRVPMYYFLSGLFFKTYSGFGQFLRRKVNNLLVTLAFFSVLAYFVAWLTFPLEHSGENFYWRCLLDPFTRRVWTHTAPLWFLLSLFEVNVLYYVLTLAVRRMAWRLAVLAAFSVVPLWLAARGMTWPLLLDTALVGLPFFAVGNAVSSVGLLKPHVADRWGLPVSAVVAVAVWLTAGHIDILMQQLPSWPQLYLVPLCAIGALMWLCKPVKQPVPVVGYWGRYSIIVLGTHDIVLTQLDYATAHLAIAPMAIALIKWGITMALMLAIVPLMVRYLPRVTAQKPLLKVE